MELSKANQSEATLTTDTSTQDFAEEKEKMKQALLRKKTSLAAKDPKTCTFFL